VGGHHFRPVDCVYLLYHWLSLYSVSWICIKDIWIFMAICYSLSIFGLIPTWQAQALQSFPIARIQGYSKSKQCINVSTFTSSFPKSTMLSFYDVNINIPALIHHRISHDPSNHILYYAKELSLWVRSQVIISFQDALPLFVFTICCLLWPWHSLIGLLLL
jgi:hypothetical protein